MIFKSIRQWKDAVKKFFPNSKFSNQEDRIIANVNKNPVGMFKKGTKQAEITGHCNYWTQKKFTDD